MAGLDDIIKSTHLTQNIHKSLERSSQISEVLKTQEQMKNSLVGLNTITELSKIFQQENSIRNLSGISMLTEVAKSMQQQQERIIKNLGSNSILAEYAKSMQQQEERITKNFGSSNMWAELAKSMQQQQERITKNFGGSGMLAEYTKSMQQQMAINPSLSAIDALTKSMQIAIPQTTLDAIASINKQHNQLFGNLRNSIEAFTKNQFAFSQTNNLQFAVSSISGQLASIAAAQRKWDLISDFEEITEEAVSLNERIFDENGVTNEGLNELKEFLQRIEIKVDKIDVDANALFWKLLTILSLILAAMGEARNWLPKPEYATKQEIGTLIQEQFGIYEKKLKEDKEFRITNRVCKVMSKPRLKSSVIEKLIVKYEVTVLQVNHNWIYVSYFSSIDNLPQTGWIIKKYLDKPEK